MMLKKKAPLPRLDKYKTSFNIIIKHFLNYKTSFLCRYIKVLKVVKHKCHDLCKRGQNIRGVFTINQCS